MRSTIPADGTALRDLMAAAIWERQNPGRRYSDCEYRWKADAEADADVALAVFSASPDRSVVLTDTERTMLAYALDQAQEHIWARDGFTDEDQEAVTSLRRLTGGTQPTGPECAGDPAPCRETDAA